MNDERNSVGVISESVLQGLTVIPAVGTNRVEEGLNNNRIRIAKFEEIERKEKMGREEELEGNTGHKLRN